MINGLKSKIKTEVQADYDLLVVMSWKDEPEMTKEATNAFREFYEQHKAYLMEVSRRATGRMVKYYGAEIINDVFNNTFLRVHDKAAIIVAAMEKYKDTDADFFRKKLRAYLGVMAKNELLRYIRQSSEFKENHVLMDDMTLIQELNDSDAEEAEEEKMTFGSKESEALSKALACLSEKERDIIIECARYQQEGKDLPDEVIKELCERWDILPGNLRVIKHRAFKKLEATAKSFL